MADTGTAELVVGSDRVDFYLTFVDENNLPINIAGAGVVVKVQGQSDDLPATDLDLSGSVYDPANGVAKFTAFGDAITTGVLGALASATFTLRGRLLDQAGKTTFTPEFKVRWAHQPL